MLMTFVWIGIGIVIGIGVGISLTTAQLQRRIDKRYNEIKSEYNCCGLAAGTKCLNCPDDP